MFVCVWLVDLLCGHRSRVSCRSECCCLVVAFFANMYGCVCVQFLNEIKGNMFSLPTASYVVLTLFSLCCFDGAVIFAQKGKLIRSHGRWCTWAWMGCAFVLFVNELLLVK